MTSETDRLYFAWLASSHPAHLAEAMTLHGSQWTDAHHTAAGERCRALADHEPDDGTPEGAELAAIYRRMDEYDTACFGSDDEAQP